jgi:hypothetical protein
MMPTPIPCTPFVCDATSATGCKSMCAADADCAAGYNCSAGACIQGAICNDDKTASVDKSGNATSCAPYRCGTDGRCLQQCASTSECAAGRVCSLETKLCVAAAPSTEEAGGCGCRTVPRGRGGWSVALVLVLLARRARRDRAAGASR